MEKTHKLFEEMISLDHLFQAYDHFKRGKRKRKDIQLFERYLEDNIFQLQNELTTLQYKPDSYAQFYVTDPKRRHISKATVRDRLIHQMVYDVLVKIFDKKFIFHSLSSRLGKGTHIGITLLQRMIRKVSSNGKKPVFALKADIKSFFDTVHHGTLKKLIRKNIFDLQILEIIDIIIDSFIVQKTASGNTGIPLGNVTSQLFANIYLHELDDFIKQELKEKYYLRFCDDFIILSNDKTHLQSLITLIENFLFKKLYLKLHPKKLILRKLSQGIDFVGYVVFEHYVLIRQRTKKRMKKKLKAAYEKYLKNEMDVLTLDQKIQSYLGILSHANQHILSQAIKNAYWIRNGEGKISVQENLKM